MDCEQSRRRLHVLVDLKERVLSLSMPRVSSERVKTL